MGVCLIGQMASGFSEVQLLAAATWVQWIIQPSSWSIILQVALGLGFVIFVHELGHFLVAKACGVKCALEQQRCKPDGVAYSAADGEVVIPAAIGCPTRKRDGPQAAIVGVHFDGSGSREGRGAVAEEVAALGAGMGD